MAGERKGRDPDKRIDDLSQREASLGWWLEIRDSGRDNAIDRDVDRSCESKDRYGTREAARAVAAMNGMAKELFVYECRYCLEWHLTRRPAKDQKK